MDLRLWTELTKQQNGNAGKTDGSQAGQSVPVKAAAAGSSADGGDGNNNDMDLDDGLVALAVDDQAELDEFQLAASKQMDTVFLHASEQDLFS